MGINLTGIFGDVANAAQSISVQDILTGLATTAGGTILVSGLQTQAGQNAIDPMHIFIHQPAGAGTQQVTGAVQGGNVMTMSAFMALSPDNQKLIQSMKYTIIPG